MLTETKNQQLLIRSPSADWFIYARQCMTPSSKIEVVNYFLSWIRVLSDCLLNSFGNIEIESNKLLRPNICFFSLWINGLVLLGSGFTKELSLWKVIWWKVTGWKIDIFKQEVENKMEKNSFFFTLRISRLQQTIC